MCTLIDYHLFTGESNLIIFLFQRRRQDSSGPGRHWCCAGSRISPYFYSLSFVRRPTWLSGYRLSQFVSIKVNQKLLVLNARVPIRLWEPGASFAECSMLFLQG